METIEEMQQQMAYFQQLQQRFQMLSQQQSQMEIGLQEIKKTIDDVKDLDPENVIYRASGSVMIKVDNFKKLIKELEEESESLELRTKTIKKEVEEMNNEMEKIQKELMPKIQNLQNSGENSVSE
tara:strand:- start:1795 stop:2169 length:375 start_codon:yes stop_codon:yes gene_type:complete